VDKDASDILDALDFIKERMANKDDVADLRLELRTFRTEADVSFRALQKHLGIERKFAA
jgi:hypothetical protein